MGMAQHPTSFNQKIVAQCQAKHREKSRLLDAFHRRRAAMKRVTLCLGWWRLGCVLQGLTVSYRNWWLLKMRASPSLSSILDWDFPGKPTSYGGSPMAMETSKSVRWNWVTCHQKRMVRKKWDDTKIWNIFTKLWSHGSEGQNGGYAALRFPWRLWPWLQAT